jgi:hypothetical protein
MHFHDSLAFDRSSRTQPLTRSNVLFIEGFLLTSSSLIMDFFSQQVSMLRNILAVSFAGFWLNTVASGRVYIPSDFDLLDNIASRFL